MIEHACCDSNYMGMEGRLWLEASPGNVSTIPNLKNKLKPKKLEAWLKW
jgi:hypothetical protein